MEPTLPLAFGLGTKIHVQSHVNQSIHACYVVEMSNCDIKVRYEGFQDLLGTGEEGKFDEWLPKSSHRLVPQRRESMKATQTSQTSAEESKLLGVSIAYLETQFLTEVKDIFGDSKQNYYDINPKLLFGPHGKGFGAHCPRDHEIHSSYVDALSNTSKGRASFLLTWFWGLTAEVVVSALVNHCRKEGLNPLVTFVWQCALCNNQYRIEKTKAQGKYEEFEPFSAMFDNRVRSIGCIVALIFPWRDPHILKRVWCNFEINIASKPQSGIKFSVVLAAHEEKDFLQAFTRQGMKAVFDSYQSIRIQNARATAEDDVRNIMQIIDPSIKPIALEVPGGERPCLRASDDYQTSSACNVVNARITSVLQAWFIEAAKEYVNQAIVEESFEAVPACTELLSLLCQTSEWEAANKIFHAVSKLAESANATGTAEYADLLLSMGACLGDQGHHSEEMMRYEEAKEAYAKAGATGTASYAGVLKSIGACLGKQGHHSEAMMRYEEAKEAYAKAGATGTACYAGLLVSMGACFRDQGHHSEAMTYLEEAKEVYAKAGATASPNYARLLQMVADLNKRHSGGCTMQ